MVNVQSSKLEFLLSKDDRLAYEPLKNEKYQKYCQQMMQSLETHRCKFF